MGILTHLLGTPQERAAQAAMQDQYARDVAAGIRPPVEENEPQWLVDESYVSETMALTFEITRAEAEQRRRARIAAAIEERLVDRLAPEIAQEIGAGAKARKVTARLYGAAWRRFAEYASAHGFCSAAYEPAIVASFLMQEFDRGVGLPMLRRHVAAIKHNHLDQRLASPTDDPLVKAAMKYCGNQARQTATKPKSKDN